MTNDSRSVSRAVVWCAFVLGVLLTLVLVPRVSFAQAGAQATTRIDAQQANDTARFVARWQRPCNASGCADSVRLAWTLNGAALPLRTRAHPLGAMWVTDTAKTLRAWCPAPTAATLTLTFSRRGVAIQPVTRTAVMGCRDALLTPPDSFVIDTGFVWRSALRVDSLARPASDVRANLFEVLRSDSTHAMVHTVRDMRPPHDVRGAVVRAPTRCADGQWWDTGDTVSVRTAQARAAQWPTQILTARVTAAWLAVDYSQCDYCRVWQARCG